LGLYCKAVKTDQVNKKKRQKPIIKRHLPAKLGFQKVGRNGKVQETTRKGAWITINGFLTPKKREEEKTTTRKQRYRETSSTDKTG